MHHCSAREQGGGSAHQSHAPSLIYPASGKRLDAKSDEAGDADQETDVGFLPTQMLNKERKGGEEKEETEEKTERHETKKYKVSGEKWWEVLCRHAASARSP